MKYIAILDYGLGNVRSIQNMFNKIGFNAVITSDPSEIAGADKYILSGVGAFDEGMNLLKSSKFFGAFEEQVMFEKKPILGICLGMQLLTKSSEEGIESGLGWVDAQTLRIPSISFSHAIPHMGWNSVNKQINDPLFEGLDTNRFYFVHSYHVDCNDSRNILGTVDYGNTLVASIRNENIFGVQFHPEKSHKFGMSLLRNFGEYNAA